MDARRTGRLWRLSGHFASFSLHPARLASRERGGERARSARPPASIYLKPLRIVLWVYYNQRGPVGRPNQAVGGNCQASVTVDS
jgi:hypothetical protein